MVIPSIFVLFLIFIFIFQHNLRKSDKMLNKSRKIFWEKEEKSLFARKAPIDTNIYIIPSIEALPNFSFEEFKAFGNEDLFKTQELCFDIAKSPMVNLSDMLNSDIRIKYGTSNLSTIESYEINYNHYIKILYQLAKGYYELNMYDEAICVLEEGIRVHTEIGDHILLLATLYCQFQNKAKFDELYEKSLTLNTLTKNTIIRNLDKLKEAH
ncbi:MAG: hypothetical protein CVU84_05790 [Firmicutes bacterium HGW-Firmicutes-1]|jgi:tetratricopeptide (TPR) repeat protein|nr:MAG: hypothetical protein CVU84_05790 [Firmicutes bacterium HGW-Firmicutes-1]